MTTARLEPIEGPVDTARRARVGDVFPAIFGVAPHGPVVLPTVEPFVRIGDPLPDPRCLHTGVLEFGPSAQRHTWVYATHGLSDPWHAPPGGTRDGYSGLGLEFVMQTLDRAEWAIALMQWLVAIQHAAAGRRVPYDPLALGNRLDAHGPIAPHPRCKLRHLMLATPNDHPDRVRIPSGTVDLITVVGITDAERDFARARGNLALVEHLTARGEFPVVDPRRACTME